MSEQMGTCNVHHDGPHTREQRCINWRPVTPSPKCAHRNCMGHEWESWCVDCGERWTHRVPESVLTNGKFAEGTFEIAEEAMTTKEQICGAQMSQLGGSGAIFCNEPKGHEGFHRYTMPPPVYGDVTGTFAASELSSLRDERNALYDSLRECVKALGGVAEPGVSVSFLSYAAPDIRRHRDELAKVKVELAGRTEQYNRALDWGQREHDIVARIWAIFGTPSYEELAGRSIYDLIIAERARADKAESQLTEMRAERGKQNEAQKESVACGKFAASFIPREGKYFSCVLPENHEGGEDECRAGGTCVTHGSYKMAAKHLSPACPKCFPSANAIQVSAPAPSPDYASGYSAGLEDAAKKAEEMHNGYARGFGDKIEAVHYTGDMAAAIRSLGKEK